MALLCACVAVLRGVVGRGREFQSGGSGPGGGGRGGSMHMQSPAPPHHHPSSHPSSAPHHANNAAAFQHQWSNAAPPFGGPPLGPHAPPSNNSPANKSFAETVSAQPGGPGPGPGPGQPGRPHLGRPPFDPSQAGWGAPPGAPPKVDQGQPWNVGAPGPDGALPLLPRPLPLSLTGLLPWRGQGRVGHEGDRALGRPRPRPAQRTSSLRMGPGSAAPGCDGLPFSFLLLSLPDSDLRRRRPERQRHGDVEPARRRRPRRSPRSPGRLGRRAPRPPPPPPARPPRGRRPRALGERTAPRRPQPTNPQRQRLGTARAHGDQQRHDLARPQSQDQEARHRQGHRTLGRPRRRQVG